MLIFLESNHPDVHHEGNVNQLKIKLRKFNRIILKNLDLKKEFFQYRRPEISLKLEDNLVMLYFD